MARNPAPAARRHAAGAPSSRPRSVPQGGRPAPAGLAIVREKLEDQIYVRLRGLIVERRILPGERILVDHLADQMGVSRTPILNALRRLSQEGVVQLLARRGIYVRRYSKAEMARLFAVREVLEGLATRLAAARIGKDEVDRFAEAFRAQDPAAHGAALRRYVELDRTFHLRLVEIADNDQLTAAMNSVNMRLFVWQDGVVRPPAETIPEHVAILQALRGRDPDAGEAAMRTHIRRSLQQLERQAATEEEASEAPGHGTASVPRSRR
jgi:DNA-binding GntR family transcriptional regulator